MRTRSSLPQVAAWFGYAMLWAAALFAPAVGVSLRGALGGFGGWCWSTPMVAMPLAAAALLWIVVLWRRLAPRWALLLAAGFALLVALELVPLPVLVYAGAPVIIVAVGVGKLMVEIACQRGLLGRSVLRSKGVTVPPRGLVE